MCRRSDWACPSSMRSSAPVAAMASRSSRLRSAERLATPPYRQPRAATQALRRHGSAGGARQRRHGSQPARLQLTDVDLDDLQPVAVLELHRAAVCAGGKADHAVEEGFVCEI